MAIKVSPPHSSGPWLGGFPAASALFRGWHLLCGFLPLRFLPLGDQSVLKFEVWGDGSGLTFGWADQTSLRSKVWRHGEKDEHEDSHLCEKCGLPGVRGTQAQKPGGFLNNFIL